MSIHSKTENMLKESLEEMLIAAIFCVGYKKENSGCLGYPAAVLLLSIADTIGSYYKGNKDFKILIDGKQKIIDSDGFKHLYILNSEYYDLQLTEKSIKRIYDNYRSLLVHNGVIAKGHFITISDPLCRSFTENALTDSKGKVYPSIHLKPLLKTTRFAVNKFIKQIDTVVPNSEQMSVINKKR